MSSGEALFSIDEENANAWYWYKKCLYHYADFTGRTRRKEFWFFMLFNNLVVWALYIWTEISIMQELNRALDYALLYGRIQYNYLTLPFVLLCTYTLAFFVPTLAVSVRRLHDLEKSGWWYLILLIPFVGTIWFIVLMCTEGSHGDNLYGSDPVKNGAAARDGSYYDANNGTDAAAPANNIYHNQAHQRMSLTPSAARWPQQ